MPTMIDEQSILDKLDTLLSPVTNIQEVYVGIPNSLDTYPCIIVTQEAWEDEFADLRDTVVTMSFKIMPYVNLEGNGLTAQETLRDIVKEIREVLGDQDNITLDGLVDTSRLTSGQYLFDQKESMLGSCEITYTVRKRFSRFS